MTNLSFIIPAYNASSTIVRCLDSIYTLALNENDFEVIVVDDCSTDNTVAVIEEYANLHNNLILLRQKENHRQGAARNRGIRESHGEYIMCVDADDEVENGIIQAIDKVKQLNVDVLFCNYLWMYSNDNIEHRKMSLPDGYITSGNDFCEQYFDTITNTCPISYIWKRDYLQNLGVPFLEDRRMEDFDWIERNVYGAKTVGYSSDIIYRVRTFENPTSTTHTCSPETSADWAHVGYRRMKFCDEIITDSPQFAEKIVYQSKCFVANVMKIRNLTKFSPRGIIQFKSRLGQEALYYLIKKGGWSMQTFFCMNHLNFIAIVNLVAFPLATFGRTFIRTVRKIRKR